MLVEAVRYLLASCSKTARSLGFLYESIALQSRAGRLAGPWAHHLARCHDTVRKAIALCPGSGRALICGSGLLLEAPMDDLLAGFSRVTCLDMVHPRAVRRRFAGQPVDFVEADLTASLGAVARAAASGSLDGLAVADQAPILGSGYDLILSLNVLSQLPVLPGKVLSERCGASQEQLEGFSRALIAGHLNWLRALPGHVCLISDTTRRFTRGADENDEDALYGFCFEGAVDTWWWDIAPSPELGGGLSQRNLVAGAADLNAIKWTVR